MTTSAQDDPQLQRVLDAITSRYNSDEDFKAQISRSVKTHSQSFVERVVEEILGFVTGTLLKTVMNWVSRLFG